MPQIGISALDAETITPKVNAPKGALTEALKQELAVAVEFLKDGMDTPYGIYIKEFNRVIEIKAADCKFEWSVWFVCHQLNQMWMADPEGKTVNDFLNVASSEGGIVCRAVRMTFADKTGAVQSASLQAVLEMGWSSRCAQLSLPSRYLQDICR